MSTTIHEAKRLQRFLSELTGRPISFKVTGNVLSGMIVDSLANSGMDRWVYDNQAFYWEGSWNDGSFVFRHLMNPLEYRQYRFEENNKILEREKEVYRQTLPKEEFDWKAINSKHATNGYKRQKGK